MADSEQNVPDAHKHVKRVLKAFQEGTALSEEECGPVCARVVRGSAPEHFEMLSKDRWKKFSWCIGPDGLQVLLRDDINILQKFRLFGFTDLWLEKKLSSGESFKLAIFPAVNAPQATWEGIFELVQKTFPSVSNKVIKFKDELMNSTFEDIESKAVFHPNKSYHDIFEASNHDDENFISLEKLEKIDDPKLWEVRGFLYNWMSLKDLFDGDGHTKSESGERGMKEFLTPNIMMKDIEHLQLADFEITFESFMKMKADLDGAAKES